MPGSYRTDDQRFARSVGEAIHGIVLRLNEILELYNIQSRQEEALQIAGEEIVRLKQTISGLQEFATRQKEEAIAVKRQSCVRLESEKADLRSQLERTLRSQKHWKSGWLRRRPHSMRKKQTFSLLLNRSKSLNSRTYDRGRRVAAVRSEKKAT